MIFLISLALIHRSLPGNNKKCTLIPRSFLRETALPKNQVTKKGYISLSPVSKCPGKNNRKAKDDSMKIGLLRWSTFAWVRSKKYRNYSGMTITWYIYSIMGSWFSQYLSISFCSLQLAILNFPRFSPENPFGFSLSLYSDEHSKDGWQKGRGRLEDFNYILILD